MKKTLQAASLLFPIGFACVSSLQASEALDYDSCNRINWFRGDSEPSQWLAICDEVMDENVARSAKFNVENAEFCIAKRSVASENSAIGWYEDPIGTEYYSVYGSFNGLVAKTNAVDLTKYEGNPHSGEPVFPISGRECKKRVKRSWFRDSDKGSCTLENQVLIHGSFFSLDYYFDYNTDKQELIFEQVAEGDGFPGLEPHYTSHKVKLKCRTL